MPQSEDLDGKQWKYAPYSKIGILPSQSDYNKVYRSMIQIFKNNN